MIQLSVRSPFAAPGDHRFTEPVVTLGRGAESSLVLADPAASRAQLEFRRDDDGWTVVDLGSHNGTQLNGEWLTAPRRVRSGDEITFGRTHIVIRFGPGLGNAPMGTSEFDTMTEPGFSPASGPTGDPAELLIGRSLAMRELHGAIQRAAVSGLTVLVTGETGTGKELVATLLHRLSSRRDGPLEVVCCPAVPPSLFEAELFGVERGVATGVEPRIGRFERAQGGTLVLDEIGDLELPAQAKLLRVLQEKKVERIGGRAPVTLDVRIVAVTNHDLAADVAAGRFRSDLFHRLRVLHLHLPPLRDRRDDLPLLVAHLLARAGRPLRLSVEAMALLERHVWPGNVRELEHLLERTAVNAAGPVIGPAELGPLGTDDLAAAAPSLSDAIFQKVVGGEGSFWELVQSPFLRREISREDARRIVNRAHAEGGTNWRGAARLLRIEAEHQKLYDFVKNHGLRESD